jgi:hypothetical protein
LTLKDKEKPLGLFLIAKSAEFRNLVDLKAARLVSQGGCFRSESAEDLDLAYGRRGETLLFSTLS